MAIPLPKPGMIFNQRYELLDVIGSGGLGTVFKAKQLDADREIALKILSAELSDDDEFKKRFIREAKALSLLSHQGIVTIYHIGVSDTGMPYIAMELIRGQSLRSLLNIESKLDSLRALRIIMQAADALGYVHANGVVHRDVKPENIIIVNQPEPDTVKLIDFGLARLVAEQKLTHTGTLLGSVAYMSPEQCQGKPADSRSDIYSLCLCFYELLTGGKPFNADSAVGIIYKQIHEPVPQIQARDVDRFDKSINEIITRATAKEVEQRYQSMADFSAALKDLQEVLKTKTSSISNGLFAICDTPLKLAILSTAGILLSLLVIFLGIQQYKSDQQDNEDSKKPARPRLPIDSPTAKVTFSSAMDIIQKANKTIGIDDRAVKILDSYLNSGKCDNRAKVLLIIRKSQLELDDETKIELALSAYKLAESEFLKNKNSINQDLYLSSGAYYVQVLEGNHNREALEQCKKVIAAAERLADAGPPQFIGIVSTPSVVDLLITEARLAIKIKDLPLANKATDELVRLEFGDYKDPTDIANILFGLNRIGDLKHFVHSISEPYAVKGELVPYAYMTFKAFANIRTVFYAALERNRLDIAEYCLKEIEPVSKFSTLEHTGQIDSSLEFGIQKVDFAFAKGDTKSGTAQLSALTKRWLNANDPRHLDRSSAFSNANPLGLVLKLLEHGMVDQAAVISDVIGDSLGNYTKGNIRVPYEYEGDLKQNRKFLLEKLTPHQDRTPIAKLIKAINSVPAPFLEK